MTFDDLTQRLRWPLMDFSGAWISLTLDYNEEGRGLGASRIAALEAAIGDGCNKRPFAIVAIARPEGGSIVLEPIPDANNKGVLTVRSEGIEIRHEQPEDGQEGGGDE